jgi:hypothetical protein
MRRLAWLKASVCFRLQTKNKCKPGAGKNLGGAVTEASVGMS